MAATATSPATTFLPSPLSPVAVDVKWGGDLPSKKMQQRKEGRRGGKEEEARFWICRCHQRLSLDAWEINDDAARRPGPGIGMVGALFLARIPVVEKRQGGIEGTSGGCESADAMEGKAPDMK